jgi:hypothetical protein
MILAMLVTRKTHNPLIYGFDDGEGECMNLAMLVIKETHYPPMYGFDDGEGVSA